MAQRGKHTIILTQITPAYETRSYMDFPSVGAGMDALVKMYEHKLKQLNPGVDNITYDISDLYKYLDTLHDICALIMDPQTNKYDPKDKEWLKAKIFQHLKGQAQG